VVLTTGTQRMNNVQRINTIRVPRLKPRAIFENQKPNFSLRTLASQYLRTLEKKHLQIESLFHTFALFLKLLSVITKGGGIDPMKP
jgi:hypothetical protein